MARDQKTILCELLVLRCQRGEREAFDQLVREWVGRLFDYVRRLVDSEAEAWDAVKQKCLQAVKGNRSLKQPSALPSWLYRIARCQVASRWRERMRDEPVSAGEQVEYLEAEPETSVGDQLADADAVHRGLGRISLAHRDVLTL